jgi:hypothetical protein
MKFAAVAIVVCFAVAACGKDSTPLKAEPSRAESKPAQSKHAEPDAAPGSHEDWCGEHEVPESMCTRCNPSLVAAFKATGDWCEDHGLPESQCLACNPDLKIERPPKQGAK